MYSAQQEQQAVAWAERELTPQIDLPTLPHLDSSAYEELACQLGRRLLGLVTEAHDLAHQSGRPGRNPSPHNEGEETSPPDPLALRSTS